MLAEADWMKKPGFGLRRRFAGKGANHCGFGLSRGTKKTAPAFAGAVFNLSK
jgi:hypothetical protein